MADLKNTKTEANLLYAFAGESQARNKYSYFASVARKEGFEQIAAIFGTDEVKAAMSIARVDPDIRAERVTVEQFRQMAEYLYSQIQNQKQNTAD